MIHTVLCDFNDPDHVRAFLDLLRHYMDDPMGSSTPHSMEKEAELIEALSSMPHAFVMLAHDTDTYVGMATCFVSYSTFAVAPVVNIHDIVVLSQERGKGIGRELLRSISAVADELGCSKITLEVRIDNPVAQALYRSEGFEDCEPPMMFWRKPL
ncbi:MAG: GNAT family N-acetyltransferase [Sulfuricurvum sp.]